MSSAKNLIPKKIRRNILDMAFSGSTVHIGCALCLVEIFSVIYRNHLRYDYTKPDDPNRDFLILSKGHGVMAQYACMKELGWSLMEENYGKGQGEAHILISHTHWDHLMGFPFFQPAYVPGNKFTICGCHPRLKKRFERQHHPDNFPAPMTVMGSDIKFEKWTPDKKKRLNNVTIKPFLLDHPGNSYAYRIESGSKIFVFASDGAYNDQSPATMDKYHAFYHNADVLVFDAHFDLIESFEKRDWGHSTSFLGVDIALNAGVKQLLLFHHDPLSNDRRIAKSLTATRRYLNHVAPNADLTVSVAHEGLEITL